MYIIWLPVAGFVSAWRFLELHKIVYFVGESLGRLDIRKGIFQSDSLYLLLFVPCIVPLTLIEGKSCLQIEQMKIE